MNRAMIIGIGCGIIVGLIVAFILLLVMKTDGSLKSKYDERQELVRGRGFKYGFFTMMVYYVIYGFLGVALEKMPVDHLVGCILGILLGVLVCACYAIWNEGYFALNEDRKRVLIIFAVIAIVNFVVAGVNMMQYGLVQDGVLTIHSLNLFCGLLFIIIGIVLFLKDRLGAKEEE